LYAGDFCIADNVEAYKMFGDGIVIAESPEDFKDKIDFYLQNTADRIEVAEKGNKFVTDNHTSIHRIAEILDYFELDKFSKQVIGSYKEFTDGER
jgi:spore maturation protein CgeB